jgi:hypothetical protein
MCNNSHQLATEKPEDFLDYHHCEETMDSNNPLPKKKNLGLGFPLENSIEKKNN